MIRNLIRCSYGLPKIIRLLEPLIGYRKSDWLLNVFRAIGSYVFQHKVCEPLDV